MNEQLELEERARVAVILQQPTVTTEELLECMKQLGSWLHRRVEATSTTDHALALALRHHYGYEFNCLNDTLGS